MSLESLTYSNSNKCAMSLTYIALALNPSLLVFILVYITICLEYFHFTVCSSACTITCSSVLLTFSLFLWLVSPTVICLVSYCRSKYDQMSSCVLSRRLHHHHPKEREGGRGGKEGGREGGRGRRGGREGGRERREGRREGEIIMIHHMLHATSKS